MLRKIFLALVAVSLLSVSAEAQKKYKREDKTEKTEKSEDEETYYSEDEAAVAEDEEVSTSIKPSLKFMLKNNQSNAGIQFENILTFGVNGSNTLKDFNPNFLKIQPNDINTKWSSWNLGFYPIGIKANLASHKLFLITGLGLQFFNFKFHDSMFFASAPTTDALGISGYEISRGATNVRKSKLGISYLSMPLMLSFETRNKKGQQNFSISAGMIGGYRLKSWVKVKLANGSVVKGDESTYNVRDFYYGPIVDLGFKDVHFFGTYALTPLHNSAVNLYPWTFGFRI